MNIWEKIPRDAWAVTVEQLPKPWPRESAEFDLVFHHAGGHGRIPSRRKLMERWGWSERAVRSTVRGFAVEMGLLTPAAPTVPQQCPKVAPTAPQPDKVEPTVSSADAPKAPQQCPKAAPEMSTGAVEKDLDKDIDKDTTSNPDGSDGAQEQPAGEGKATKTRKDFARCADAWQAAKPGGARPSMSKGQGKAMRARMGEYGADAVVDVISWASNSRHDRAVFLRERGLSLVTLMGATKFEMYLDFAREEAQKRSRPKPAAWQFPTPSTPRPSRARRRRRTTPTTDDDRQPRAGGYVEALRRKAAAATGGDA